jgi:hypothetical protein
VLELQGEHGDLGHQQIATEEYASEKEIRE